MIIRRMIGVDDETWAAITDHAAATSENISAVVRDGMRAYLRKHGYRFTTEPRRYGRRGEGRRTTT